MSRRSRPSFIRDRSNKLSTIFSSLSASSSISRRNSRWVSRSKSTSFLSRVVQKILISPRGVLNSWETLAISSDRRRFSSRRISISDAFSASRTFSMATPIWCPVAASSCTSWELSWRGLRLKTPSTPSTLSLDLMGTPAKACSVSRLPVPILNRGSSEALSTTMGCPNWATLPIMLPPTLTVFISSAISWENPR